MTQQVERMLPLYEGKMGWQYDHRAAGFVGLGDTDILPNTDRSDDARVLPRYWVREEVAHDRLGRRRWGTETALLGFRRVARNTDERTVIASLLPWGAASYGWILSAGPDVQELALLIAQYNSYPFDYMLRQFLSQPSVPQGTFSQLPILPREAFEALDEVFGGAAEWVTRRVAVLTGSGNELHTYSRALESDIEPPVPWVPETRDRCRLELDAALFHLFGIARDDVDYIMESFPIVKRKDIAAHGTFRTKDMILEVYDGMQVAIDAGTEYRSQLDEELA